MPERFRSQFSPLATIRHPNLLVLREMVVDTVYSMDRMDGVSLLSYVRPCEERRPRLDIARLRSALRQTARATAPHQAGFVHGDVKPSNLMVGGDGRVVLIDFDQVVPRTPKSTPWWARLPTSCRSWRRAGR